MHKSVAMIAAALLGATAASALSGSGPLDERVLELELQQALPQLADELAPQPPAVRAAFVDYAGDRELVLNARLALLRYPSMAPRVIATYGPQPDFRDILRRFGPAVVPPVHYFMGHDLLSLRLRATVADWLAGDADGLRQTADTPLPHAGHDGLTPRQRGDYAIAFIGEQGHEFLGQFVIDPAGEVSRVQSDRFATWTKRFLTSGVTGLEAKWRRGEARTVADYGWAGVDVLAPLLAFKAARLGKLAARSTKATRATARVAKAGGGIARVARIGRTAAKVGVVAGVGYVVLNPGVINSIGQELAGWTGLPGWLVSGGLWFALLLPLLFLLDFANRWLIRPARRVTGWLIAAPGRPQRPRTASNAFPGPVRGQEPAPTDG